uniref:Uncharacterized protein n=1 Tax=Rhizophora mucronata TaxID=61149 RepID=A0A2P2P384_RHIMU
MHLPTKVCNTRTKCLPKWVYSFNSSHNI